MDKKRSQLYNFASEAIPVLFHSQTNEFLKYIEKDGLDFLKFWWDHVGLQLPEEKLSTFQNINFEFFPVDDKKKIIFISFPKPHENGDVFFLGLISAPEKRFAWVRLPTQRVLALVYRPELPRQTEIGDITPRGIFVPLGAGPEPEAEKFLAIVKRMAANKPSQEL